MKFNIALIGYGKWAKIISKEIYKNENFILKGIVSLSAKQNNLSTNVYKTLEQLLDNENIDCLYIAKNPSTNIDVLKKVKTKNIPIIFEKPLSNNSKNCLEIINIIKENKIKVLTNLPNLYADTFKKTSQFIIENKNKISKIIICEGGKNLKNDKIHPLLDWGIHPMSYFFSFFNTNDIQNINYKNIFISKNKSSIVSKFNIMLKNNIEIKIMTGNGFKNKIRKLKIFLDNGDTFINDLINHKININNKMVLHSKNSPLQNLLDNFYLLIKNNYNTDIKNLESSYDSIKIIERYIN